MKRTILSIAFLVVSIFAFAQEAGIKLDGNKADDDNSTSILQNEADTTVIGSWRMGGTLGLNLSQTYLSNWAAGGQNAISVTGLVNLFGNYKKNGHEWDNSLDLAYGILTQGDYEQVLKTDDRIEFSSKYGRRLKEKWFLTGMLNFRTQFAPGYEIEDGEVNEDVKISDFMAPAYSLTALGIDFKPTDKFSVLMSPTTMKTTIVLDDSLATNFGVEEGENIRFEIGGYIKIAYTTEVVENVTWQTKLDLFSNYLNNPENIDVNWENLISMKVNDFISVNITTQLIYDDDIILKKNDAVLNENGEVVEAAEFGPGLQFKETLAVGFSYKF
ncbi:DUF3078 domain-containing protein [Halocola ammonii]